MAAVMAFIASLSPAFRGCYLLGGFSNTADGALARHCLTQTKQAARLDSGADFPFFIGSLRIFRPAGWLLGRAACIFVLLLCNLFIARHKYRTFVSLHTYANKAAGVLLFFSPFLLRRVGAAGLFLCAVAFFASLEETLLLLCQSRLDVNCKSIFLFPVDSFPFSYFFVLNAFLSFSLVFLQNNGGLFGPVFFLCFAACFIQYKNPRCKKRGLCASK